MPTQTKRRTAKRKTGNGVATTKPGKTTNSKVSSLFNPSPCPIAFDQLQVDRVYQQIWALGTFTHWDCELASEALLAAHCGHVLEPSEVALLQRVRKAHNASKSDRPIDCPLEQKSCETLVNELIEICKG